MLNLGTVQQGSTVNLWWTTNAADGGAEAYSATIEVADFDLYAGASETQRTSTAGWTLNEAHDTITGIHTISIDTSDDTDSGFYAAGSTFTLTHTPDETLDSQTVAAVIGTFRIESNSEKAARLLRENLYPEAVISTTTSNDTSTINMTDILDAQADDDHNVGMVYGVRDATDGAIAYVVVTNLTSLVATVELYRNGGAMPFTVAAGDYVWLVGPARDDRLTFTVEGQADANTRYIAGTAVIGAGASGNKWRA